MSNGLHPVNGLIAWLGFVFLMQWLAFEGLIVAAMAALLLACGLARGRCLMLLRRSRWLIVSLIGIYAFATPGEFVPGLAGTLTYEGLRLGSEQVIRLLALLASLALLHQGFGSTGLLSGMHRLMGPFPWRDVTVVRLMLVLDYVEQKQGVSWQDWLSPNLQHSHPEIENYVLSVPAYRWTDALMALAVTGLLVALALV